MRAASCSSEGSGPIRPAAGGSRGRPPVRSTPASRGRALGLARRAPGKPSPPPGRHLAEHTTGAICGRLGLAQKQGQRKSNGTRARDIDAERIRAWRAWVRIFRLMGSGEALSRGRSSKTCRHLQRAARNGGLNGSRLGVASRVPVLGALRYAKLPPISSRRRRWGGHVPSVVPRATRAQRLTCASTLSFVRGRARRAQRTRARSDVKTPFPSPLGTHFGAWQVRLACPRACLLRSAPHWWPFPVRSVGR